MIFKRMAVAMAAAQMVFLCGPAQAQPAPASDWADRVIPLETFGQFPTMSRPRISPGGKVIAAKLRSGDIQALALVPIDDSAGKPEVIARDGDFTRNKQGEKEIYDYSWIDDDNLLIFIRSRENFQGEWYDARFLVAYNRLTRKLTPLGWDDAFLAAADVLWRSQPGTGTPHILLQRYRNSADTERLFQPEVIDINVVTGESKIVMRPNSMVADWGADSDGVVRFGSTYDRSTGKTRILYRPNADSNFRTILSERIGRNDDPVIPSIILHGSKKAYAYSNHEGFRALYEYDLETMALGKKVFGLTGYDIDGATTTADRTALQSIYWTDQRTHTRYLEPRLAQVQGVLEESFGKGNVDIESADLKREKILFTYAALGQAPTIYLFDTTTGDIKRLAHYNKLLKDSRLNPVSVIHYPTTDGKKVEAILTMPRHRSGQKNLALIIMPHGGPWVRDSADWDPYMWAQAMAEQGYVVIQPNYRGSTGYGREWGAAADGNWGQRMQDDLNDAIPYLASQGIADPKRVCMMGWSYGGYAASRAAQRDGSKYRCAISGAGVHDLPAMVSYDKNYLGAYAAKMALGSAGANLRAISPGLHPEEYSIPILIVHGKKDVRVPVAQSRDLVQRLKKAGKREGVDFVYVEQPLNTHNLLREEDRIQFLMEAKKFLEQHNAA